MSAVVAMPPVKPGGTRQLERFAGGPGRRRVPVHPDRELRGPAAAARRVAADPPTRPTSCWSPGRRRRFARNTWDFVHSPLWDACT